MTSQREAQVQTQTRTAPTADVVATVVTPAQPSAHRPLVVEYWPTARLVPYARNARTHTAAQVAEIATSIRAFGFTNPILVAPDA